VHVLTSQAHCRQISADRGEPFARRGTLDVEPADDVRLFIAQPTRAVETIVTEDVGIRIQLLLQNVTGVLALLA